MYVQILIIIYHKVKTNFKMSYDNDNDEEPVHRHHFSPLLSPITITLAEKVVGALAISIMGAFIVWGNFISDFSSNSGLHVCSNIML